MELRLDGKVALVTGGAKGIGAACAAAFADAGAKVSVCDVDDAALEDFAGQVRARGGECFTMACDVGDAAQVAAYFAASAETLGPLDIVVNNAGVAAPIVPLAETEENDFDRLMAINVKGVWLCLREALRHMEPRGQGAIINMDSALGKRTFPGASLYVSSKFAVAGMTRNAAVEYAEHGIRINGLCPGNVLTPLLENTTSPEVRDMLAREHPMKRLGTVEEIAGAAVFLASDAASFMTGELLSVDGGWTAL